MDEATLRVLTANMMGISLKNNSFFLYLICYRYSFVKESNNSVLFYQIVFWVGRGRDSMKISFHLARVKARNGTGACFKTFLCQSFPCLVAYIENKDRFHIYTIHYQTVFVTYYIHNTGV